MDGAYRPERGLTSSTSCLAGCSTFEILGLGIPVYRAINIFLLLLLTNPYLHLLLVLNLVDCDLQQRIIGTN